MKKFIIFVVLLIVIGVLWATWRYYESEQSRRSIELSATAEVTLGDIESVVTAQGTLEPKNYVDVGAQVSGRVEKLHVEIGDTVKQGDLIAEIDPDVYESKVLVDEARLKNLQAQKVEQSSLIKQANQKYVRNKNLYRDKAVSKEVLQDAETALEVAKAKLLALDAQIEETQSTLEGDRANLNYTKIYAPIGGTVVDQSVQEGQTINANQTAPVIVQIANLDVMTVRAQVAEADIMKLEPGMKMYFTTLESGNRRWEGEIRQILPKPETINDVVLFNVLIDVDNKDHKLMTGMTTQMFFVLAKAKNVPLIPLVALGKRVPESDTEAGEAYQVRVLTGDRYETRTVIISISNRSQAAVANGLKVGDRVLINPSQMKTGTSTGQQSRHPRLLGL